MGKLSAGQRARLPKSVFAGPGRSFPVPDASHARFALSVVSRSLKAGHITADQAAKIRAEARAKLGGGR